ncbi:MAG: hypothetical protein ACJ72A_02955 [Nocardioidaceae bacterium]
MDNKHCAQCREVVGANERRVRLVRADMDFHADCWAALHVTMQQDYESRTQDGGIVALLVPYHRTQVGAWLPPHDADAADAADAAGEADEPGLPVAS